MTDLYRVPADLPVPADDGACDHLPGLWLPALALPGTDGQTHDLSGLPGRTILYVYPRTGEPGQPLPTDWDVIPGARGCTPQSCAFRDRHSELAAAGAQVYGLSTQDPAYQREAAERLHLPFALLSDEALAFGWALRLPTFAVDGMTLLRRLYADRAGGPRRARLLSGLSARAQSRRRADVAARPPHRLGQSAWGKVRVFRCIQPADRILSG